MKKLFLFGVILPGLCANLSAAPIAGTFNLAGTVTVTNTAINWNSDLAPTFLSQMFSLTAGAGSFAGENGQNGIDNLNIVADPVGSQFTNTPFIVFDVLAGLPVLDINFIFAGTGGSAGCSAGAAVTTPPQTCTPANAGGSPFTFTNNPPPGLITSTAAFVFSGVTSDGLSSWVGIFTSQFTAPFQTVLAGFGPGGQITNSYSGTIIVTPLPPVPEPGPMVLMGSGLGLLLMGVALRKRFHRQS
jgi:hypothetical protein